MQRIVSFIFVLLLLVSSRETKAQQLSTNPDEYINQVVGILNATNQPPAISVANTFKSSWQGGSFNEAQQKKIIALSQVILSKKLRPAVDLKDFLATLYQAADTKGVKGSKMDQLLDVTTKAFKSFSEQQIITYIERIKSFFYSNALYTSQFNNLLTTGTNYEFIFVDASTNKTTGWFAGWDESDPQGQFDQEGNPITYPHPKVVGPVILFTNTSLYFVTPYDSLRLADTKGAFVFKEDTFIGQGGKFDWDNLTVDTGTEQNEKIAGKLDKIYADFDRYSIAVSKPRFEAEDVVVTYSKKFPKKAKGSFEYLSKARKNEKNVKYPVFKSYDEDYNLQLDDNIAYRGGVMLKGKELYGYSKTTALLDVNKGSELKMQVRGKELYLGEEKISSPSVSFSFYIFGDSLFHSDVSLLYSLTDSGNDSLAKHTFRLFKEKINDDIPFIDNYHKMYITADVAVYSLEKNKLDFYIVGANDKVPAIFESYSYYNEERFQQLKGGYKFHPLKLIEGAGANYGSTNEQGNVSFFADALTDLYKIPPATVKAMLRTLSRRGYIIYNEYTDEVTILNRTSHTEASSNYIRVMERINRSSTPPKLTEEQQRYAEHDYDDMFIKSISPREAKQDSVIVDTVRFNFTREKMQLARLKGLNVFFTQQTFRTQIDNPQRDTNLVFNDTLLIQDFTVDKRIALNEQLERRNIDVNKSRLEGLQGFVVTGERIEGEPRPNATIDADGGAITIRGIEQFTISNKLNVKIIPRYKEIQIFGNRVINMEKGEVTVGNFRFIGRNFILPYDEFRLTMGEIDTVLFTIRDIRDTTKRIELGDEIRMGAGELQINQANNKSGLKKGVIPGGVEGDTYEAYPKLKVEEGGKIFFDQFYRERGAYHKHQAYFDIPKIDLDSLTSHIPKFSGVFYSNMFPDIEEQLIPLYDPDYTGIESKYSLGFIHKPKESYKIYETGADFTTDSLVMFKTKLVAQGNNEIKHFSYTLKGKDIVFAPDSLHTDQASIDVRQEIINDIDYPRAYVSNGHLQWFTTIAIDQDTLAIDSMTIRSKKELITVFDDKNPATINGIMSVTPQGLWGTGILLRKDFFILAPQTMLITSKRIYTPDNVDNIIDFKVNSTAFDPYDAQALNKYAEYPAIMQGSAVEVDFDLVNGLCKIVPNQNILSMDDTYPFITFPYAQFKTSIREAQWDLNQKEITMRGDTTSLFSSTKYLDEEGDDTKDLKFLAQGGTYDISNLGEPKLDLEGVPYVVSADALIMPHEGKMTILKGADVQKLSKAKLEIDTLNAYHKLFDGNIKINNRVSFEGDAIYRFVSVDSDTTNIQFDRFDLVTERIRAANRKEDDQEVTYTKSNGRVRDTDNMFITSRIQYKGMVEMRANRKDLFLDGFIKLDLKSRDNSDSWIPYKSDTSAVLVEVQEKMDMDAEVLTSGLHYDPVEGRLYTTFLSPKDKFADEDLFLASGFLTYIPEINEFKITSEEKATGKTYEGNLLIFDDSKAKVGLEGKVNLVDEEISQYMEAATYGKIDLNKGEYDFDTFIVFDFPNPPNAFNKFGDLLQLNREDEARATENDFNLLPKLAEFVGDEKARLFRNDSQQVYIPMLSIDKSLLKSLVINKVNLQWSEGAKAFYSTGKIGVSNIYSKDINAEFDGYVEIRKTVGGDIVTVYIEAPNDIWLYFSMQNSILSAVSSVDAINAEFERGKPQKRIGEYAFELTGDDSPLLFKRRFKEAYRGIKAEQPKEKVEKKEEKEEEGEDGF